jgi:single-strand DNA-binding protein
VNVVILRGALSSDPVQRTLPSGDVLTSFEVTIRPPELPAESVPVVMVDAPRAAIRLRQGAEVVVAGRVRRRFFRTSAGIGSRTEVVAHQLVGARRRAQIERMVAAAQAEVASLADAAGSA